MPTRDVFGKRRGANRHDFGTRHEEDQGRGFDARQRFFRSVLFFHQKASVLKMKKKKKIGRKTKG